MGLITINTQDRKTEQLASLAASIGGFDSPVRGAEFKAALPRVAERIVSHGWTLLRGPLASAHIRVTFSGTGAFCRHNSATTWARATMNLPALSDTRVLSRAEANRWLGYCLHECFHVIFTNRNAWDVYCAGHSPFRGRILNAVEDARIERDGVQLGVASGFLKVGSLLMAHLMAEGGADVNPNDARQAPWVFAVGLRHYATPGFDRLFASIRPDLREVLVWARGEMKNIPPANELGPQQGTEAAAALAEQISDKLKAIYAEPQTSQPEDGGFPGATDEPGQPGEEGGKVKSRKRKADDESESEDEGEEGGASDGEDEGEDGDAGAPGEGDEGDEEGEGAGADGEDEDEDGEGLGLSGDDAEDGDEGEGSGEGEGDDADDADGEGEGEGEGEGDDDGANVPPAPGSGGGGADTSQQSTGAKKDDPVDVDALRDSEIPSVEPSVECDRDFNAGDAVESFGACPEVDVDQLEWANPVQNAKSAERILRSVKNLVGARGALRRLLQRTDSHGETRGMKGGHLVPSRLYRASLGDDAVFSRRWEQEGVDVAVSIVIDTSGSMKGECIRMASQTALVLSEQLVQTPGCKVEVLGFSSYNCDRFRSDIDVYQEYRNVGADNVMEGACSFRVYKRFNEHIGKMRQRWAQMQYADGGTPDLAALNGAALRLSKTQAGRKIIFFICDGSGSHISQFRGHVDRLSKRHGVLVIGLGIKCDLGFADRFQFGGTVWDVNRLSKDALDLIVRSVEKSGKV